MRRPRRAGDYELDIRRENPGWINRRVQPQRRGEGFNGAGKVIIGLKRSQQEGDLYLGRVISEGSGEHAASFVIFAVQVEISGAPQGNVVFLGVQFQFVTAMFHHLAGLVMDDIERGVAAPQKGLLGLD